jgi:hypothetical protein
VDIRAFSVFPQDRVLLPSIALERMIIARLTLARVAAAGRTFAMSICRRPECAGRLP